MPEKQLEPHVISCSAAISTCGNGDVCQKALDFLWALPEKQPEPHVISYSAAISTCEKGGQWKKALHSYW